MITVKDFSELTSKDKLSIRSLILDCIRYEQLELTSPDLDAEEGTVYLYWLPSKAKKLVSVLFCFDMEDYMEVSAYTSPEHRCQGFFTSLFQRLMEESDEVPICFYPDGNSYDALVTLEALGCEYSGTEHLMRLDSPDIISVLGKCDYDGESPVSVRRAIVSDLPALAEVHSAAFEMEKKDSVSFLEQAFAADEEIWCICSSDSSEPAGVVLTFRQPAETALYGLAIHPDYQKKGYAKAAVKLLCTKFDLRYPISLHVTEENEAAYHIYRDMGFVTVQELMEYWY